MKTAESRTASNTVMRKSNPFFSKESDGHFFGSQQRTSSSPALSSSVQAKLNVGSPNDPYEKEADSTADKVVQRLAEPAVQTKPLAPVPITAFVQKKCNSCEQEEKLQKKDEEETPAIDKKLQRKPIFDSNAEPPDDENNIQRKCAECEKEEKLQKKRKTTLYGGSPFSKVMQNQTRKTQISRENVLNVKRKTAFRKIGRLRFFTSQSGVRKKPE